ncbi:unnamed protein product [marine sediment metagenome]|uniref:Thiolase N-terminal domain-containing protein n=1 Tax=marine sediment metagenome TaxID=412755 RepID=X1LNF1_9ZZZZ
MREVVVISAVRTPIGRYCGVLRDMPVYKLPLFWTYLFAIPD